MSDDTRERLARLEVQFDNLKDDLKDTHTKVVAMHDLLMQAKGAKWVIVGTATIASAVTATIVKLLPFFNSWPK